MTWIINDLSLDGLFYNEKEIIHAFRPLLELRFRNINFKNSLLCSRNINTRPVAVGMNFMQCVTGMKDRLFKQQMLSWFANAGPFWEDDRAACSEDYFECNGVDVTDLGLGENARRSLKGWSSFAFSFPGAHQSFLYSPLHVVNGLVQEADQAIKIINHWQVEEIEQSLTHAIQPTSWETMLEKASLCCPSLILSQQTIAPLLSHPFHRAACNKILSLLTVLNNVCMERDGQGAFTARGQELFQNHFTGKYADFSDESDSNLNNPRFKKELTFADPVDPETAELYCPWHGKIQTPAYRIHFPWPIPVAERKLKIVYIGPKITKR